jgi:hypothetical protein
MQITDLSKMLDRMEAASPGPWDTTVDVDGQVTLTSPNHEVLATNISVEDAWYISHAHEDVKHLIDEVLDLRRLIYDVHVLLTENETHGNIMSYLESFMRERMG